MTPLRIGGGVEAPRPHRYEVVEEKIVTAHRVVDGERGKAGDAYLMGILVIRDVPKVEPV